MRDSSGAVIGALSVPTFLGSLIAEFEVLACLRAMQFALEIGLTWVTFEGDSAAMINALRHGLGELTCHGNVLDDIWAHISNFQFCDFNLVSRLCNSVANALAKKVSSVVGLQVWLGDLPVDIAPLFFHDVHWILFWINSQACGLVSQKKKKKIVSFLEWFFFNLYYLFFDYSNYWTGFVKFLEYNKFNHLITYF